MPKQYDTGRAEWEFAVSPKAHYRQIFYEGLDLIVNCIRNRFDQPSYKVYRNCSTKTDHKEEYALICHQVLW